MRSEAHDVSFLVLWLSERAMQSGIQFLVHVRRRLFEFGLSDLMQFPVFIGVGLEF